MIYGNEGDSIEHFASLYMDRLALKRKIELRSKARKIASSKMLFEGKHCKSCAFYDKEDRICQGNKYNISPWEKACSMYIKRK